MAPFRRAVRHRPIRQPDVDDARRRADAKRIKTRHDIQRFQHHIR